MTTEPPGSLVAEGVRSLEVRWMFPGRLETSVVGWFGRFRARTESREYTYLVDPQLGGLSLKVRGGRALEVKVYRGSPGVLDVTGRARGRLLSWQKRSFPFSPLSQEGSDPAGWTPVLKRAAHQPFLFDRRTDCGARPKADPRGPVRGRTHRSPQSLSLLPAVVVGEARRDRQRRVLVHAVLSIAAGSFHPGEGNAAA